MLQSVKNHPPTKNPSFRVDFFKSSKGSSRKQGISQVFCDQMDVEVGFSVVAIASFDGGEPKFM